VVFNRHEFDSLDVLEAEAIGEPGNRRFRLIVGTADDLISLWMEKEQLHALGLAIEQLIEQLQTTGLSDTEIESIRAPLTIPVPPTAPDYQVSKMAIGFDEEKRRIAIFAHDLEQPDEDDPVFSARVSLENASALSEQIAEVVAAGRPRCPRCGAIIEPDGHVCPHDNGHFPWQPE
jgi:uncharacterized repeat protein (TIGR03847 family)